jgi:hypothetical protein
VAEQLGSACEEKVQCSKLGALVDCVDKKCTKKEGDSQKESRK